MLAPALRRKNNNQSNCLIALWYRLVQPRRADMLRQGLLSAQAGEEQTSQIAAATTQSGNRASRHPIATATATRR
jgi:hypothetical protein